MSDATMGFAVVAALACAGYLLVRYEVLDKRDAVAGAGLIAALFFIVRLLTKQDPNNIQTTSKQAQAPDPTPPTRDVERVIAESDKTLAEEPSDDVHDRLRDALKKHHD